MTIPHVLPGPGTTIAIEASAGTGKTWTISHLVARFIAETEMSITQIAIVTFSVASTCEVRQRTQAHLADTARILALDTPPPVGSELWCENPQIRSLRLGRIKQALEDFDTAPIMTTHSFCDHLLTLLGILADHDPSDRLKPNLHDHITNATSDHYLLSRSSGDPPQSYEQALMWSKEAVLAPHVRLSPDNHPATDFAQSVRQLVDEAKRRAGLYTFDDMLLRCRDALVGDYSHQARQRLCATYPVLLVDEFQDTDTLQWEIIEAGFVGRSSVVLIGDPKQSIYGFRGTDVQAYLQATDGLARTTLNTNYRSSPAVVEAVGNLVKGTQLGDERITVTPVDSHPNTPALIADSPWDRPVRLRIPDDLTERSVAEARALIDQDIVCDLTDLLNSSPHYQPSPTSAPRRLRPGDIAILISTNKRGITIVDRLMEQGIPAVLLGSSTVFNTDSSRDWLLLLRALTDGTLVHMKAASLTSLIGWELADLVEASPSKLSNLVTQLRHLAHILDTGGALGVFEWLMDQGDLSQRLGADVVGERQLIDLGHLAQLLDQPHPGFSCRRNWLLHQRHAISTRDEAGRRLPIRSDAVRIMTIHQSKGLQFPIVYLPELGDRHLRDTSNSPVLSHDDSRGRVLDLGVDNSTKDIHRRAREEDSQESLRKAYVGLTRGCTQVTSWWVPTKMNTAPSALHRFLFSDSAIPPDSIAVEVCDPHNLTISGVHVETMEPSPVTPSLKVIVAGGSIPHPPRPELHRPVDMSWRRTSFSSLTADIPHHFPSLSPESTSLSQPDEELDQLSPMAHMPGGVGFGSLVHAVFEYSQPGEDLHGLIESNMAQLDLSGFSADELAEALKPGLATPLGEIADGLSLSDIPPQDRLAEMEFEMALAHGATGSTAKHLAALCRLHMTDFADLAPYVDVLETLSDQRELRGYLTGSIDAVVRINNRYLIMDYKTNHLGDVDSPLTLRSYTRESMAEAMISSHYPLQALLYQVALHRFLRGRIDNYDAAVHLGGVAYLFVRGMAGPTTPIRNGTTCGVFTWHPSTQLIMDISDLLSGVTP
ncbi:MAG: UvrD-helicase domain-containing protein [Propionibacteriaceae bacterium]|nr:UvrD-helicase domain-containing protein [Propionibacteriaceae bacterium]